MQMVRDGQSDVDFQEYDLPNISNDKHYIGQESSPNKIHKVLEFTGTIKIVF